MIVILSNSDDSHACAVVEALRILDYPYLPFWVDKLSETNLVYEPQKEGFLIDDIRLISPVILNRRGITFLRRSAAERNASADARFIAAELVDIVVGALDQPGSIWINHPENNRRSSRKLVQLSYAAAQGFPYPGSIVTNRLDNLEEFSQTGGIVYKTVGRHGSYDGKFIFTTGVEAESVSPTQLSRCPALFQTKIKKELDIRIVLAGNHLFGASTEAQGHTHVDWRYYCYETRWEAWDIPAGVAKFVQEMCSYFELHFGAFDFVQSTTGEIFFLELNPNGQWLWLQEQAGLDIATAIANTLIDHDDNR